MGDIMQHGGPAGVDAFLGKGCKVNGKLVFEGKGRIEGHVEGEITAQDTLTIGDGAVVNAKVSGTAIVIEGRVNGDVTAKQRLELRAQSRVHGNITTPSLIVQDGAIFEGQCTMKGEGAAHVEKTDGGNPLSFDRRAREAVIPPPVAAASR